MSAWVQPMLNPRDCIHGSLARKCELCERDEEIHVLREALTEIAEQGPGVTVGKPWRRWREIAREVLSVTREG